MSVQKISIFICLFLLLGLPVGHTKVVYNTVPANEQVAPPVERPKKKIKKKRKYKKYRLSRGLFEAKKIDQMSPIGIIAVILFALFLLSPIAFGILGVAFQSLGFFIAMFAVLFLAFLTALIFNILGSYGKYFSMPFSLYVALLSLIFMIIGIVAAIPVLWIGCLALLGLAIALLIWSLA